MKTTWTWYISLFVPLCLAPVSTVSAHDTEFRLLAPIRQATAHFHHVKTAQAVGYAPFLDCVDEPGEGAMGIHFVHNELISDAVLDPLLPEALMYEPESNGRLRLVAWSTSSFRTRGMRSMMHPQLCWVSSCTLCPAPIGMACQRSTSCTSGYGSTTLAASSMIGILGCAALRTDTCAPQCDPQRPMYRLC